MSGVRPPASRFLYRCGHRSPGGCKAEGCITHSRCRTLPIRSLSRLGYEFLSIGDQAGPPMDNPAIIWHPACSGLVSATAVATAWRECLEAWGYAAVVDCRLLC